MAKKKANIINPSFKTPKQFKEQVDEYFSKKTSYHTITGLCVHLGFSNRKQLSEYLNDRPEYRDVASYAVLRLEEVYEQRTTQLRNPTGAIFVLKTLGWELDTKDESKSIVGTSKRVKKETNPTITVKIRK